MSSQSQALKRIPFLWVIQYQRLNNMNNLNTYAAWSWNNLSIKEENLKCPN